MSEALQGKVALVTGGSRGIGAAVALRLAEDGADVAFTYVRNAERAEAVSKEITAIGRRVVAIRADSGDVEAVTSAVDRTVDELGRLDVLVNNAGVGHMGPIEELSVDQLDETLAVNVRGQFVAVRAAVRHLPAGGRIITIGSCVARRAVLTGMTLYAMSKTALTGLTTALARELGPRGITANVVHPGPIDTDMNPADGSFSDAQRAAVALGRYGEPSDVAATVAHLAGEGGRYITGASIDVDGGFAA